MYLGSRRVSSPLRAPVLCLVSSSVPIPVRVRVRVRRRGGGSWARKLKKLETCFDVSQASVVLIVRSRVRL